MNVSPPMILSDVRLPVLCFDLAMIVVFYDCKDNHFGLNDFRRESKKTTVFSIFNIVLAIIWLILCTFAVVNRLIVADRRFAIVYL